MANYLDLEFKTGLIYQYSKTGGEGFETYVSSTGNQSYRKYFKKGIFGHLLNVSIVDVQGRGLKVNIALKEEGGEINILSLAAYSQRGDVDDYVESLIRLLPNLERGAEYRVFPYSMEVTLDSGKTTTNRGISFKYITDGEVGEKVEPAIGYQKRDQPLGENEIPSLVFEQRLGKYRPTDISKAEKKSFLEGVLDKYTKPEELGYVDQKNSESAPAPQSAPAKAAAPAAAPAIEDEDDDVPF